MGADESARRFVSVGTKLAVATVTLVALVSTAVYFGLTTHERRNLLDAKKKSAGMVLELLCQALRAPVVFSDDTGVLETLQFLEGNPDVTHAAVWRVSADGKVGDKLGEFQRIPGSAGFERPAVDASRIVVRDTELSANGWVFDNEGSRVALARIRFSLLPENRAFGLLSARIMQVSLAVALSLSLLLVLLARLYIIKPLGSLYVAARRLEGGELIVLPAVANDEVGHLSRAFSRMAAAIDKRERAIAQQNEDMRLVLDSVGQGFLVLAADGTLQGQHSAIVDRWFGPARSGQSLWQYLAPHDPVHAEWLELTWANFGVQFMPLEVCLSQLPRRFTTHGRVYDFEYRPLLADEEKLDKMVVVISDVTDLVAREGAEREQRELVAIFNRIVSDRMGFLGFYEDATSTVRRIADLASGDERQVLRDVHTLKSNAGIYQVQSVAALCEEIETRAADENRSVSPSERAAVAEAWKRIEEVVARYLGTASERALELSRSDYDALMQAVEQREPHARLAERLSSLFAEPSERVLSRLEERVAVLARRLGKGDVKVSSDGHRLRFPTTRFAPLWSAMTHVVRNTVDHGLETETERRAKSKPVPAQVTLSTRVDGDTLHIAVADDGKGVDWSAVQARARTLGLPHATREDLARALFSDGFTTAEATTELSGRGVGLSAVRAIVEDMGGRVTLESEPGRGTSLHIALPAKLLCADTRSVERAALS